MLNTHYCANNYGVNELVKFCQLICAFKLFEIYYTKEDTCYYVINV